MSRRVAIGMGAMDPLLESMYAPTDVRRIEAAERVWREAVTEAELWYERGEYILAEEADMRAEALATRLEALLAALEETEEAEHLPMGFPLAEVFAALYAEYVHEGFRNRLGPDNTPEEALAQVLRWEAGPGASATDAELIEAARDAYEARAALRERYREKQQRLGGWEEDEAAAVIDYGLRVLQEGIDFSSRGFDIMRDMMEAPPHLQDDKAFWRDSFVYLSRYRPFPMAVKPHDLGFGGEVRHLRGERYSWVFTDEPLPLEAVYRFELAPHFTHNTRGHYILALARAMGAPVELVKLDPCTAKTEVAFLFRNPRGVWQLSYFEEGFGPTGHIEANPHGQGVYRATPESMVEDAFSQGYTRFQPGTLDAIAETFLPPDELRRALPGYSGDGLP